MAGFTGIVNRHAGPNPNGFGPRGAVRLSSPVRAYVGDVLKFHPFCLELSRLTAMPSYVCGHCGSSLGACASTQNAYDSLMPSTNHVWMVHLGCGGVQLYWLVDPSSIGWLTQVLELE